MKHFYTAGNYRIVALTIIFMVMSYAGMGQKVFTPASNNNIAGGNTYCQNITAGGLTYTYNTCNTGTGSSIGTFVTIKWYKNSVNSTTGGTVVSTTLVRCALTATGSTTYQPSTAVVGTLHYYCIITWTDAGTCNATGSVTSTTVAVTVSPTPETITGSTTGCIGTVSTLYNTVAGGTWTSSSSSVATVSATGGVGSASVGTTTITYTIGLCKTTTSFTVITAPAAITGGNTVCENTVLNLNTTNTGGVWVSDDATKATVSATTPVNVTGIAAGNTTISYVISPSCYSTKAITVELSPAAITGATSACIGTTTTLFNTIGGGVWTSSAAARATIGLGTGVVSAVSTGATIISYTLGSCRAILPFTVNSNPANITGATAVCQNAVTTFSDASTGGTWSTADAAIATVNAVSPAGVTGVGTGSTTITYTLPTGCFAVKGINVNIAPAAISGATSACLGSTVSLGNTVGGGTWTSVTPAKATVNSSGLVTTVANGTSIISYTIGTCASTITFTTLITPPAIGGASTNLCQGATRSYTNTAVGGTWSSSNNAVASINPTTGLLTGVAGGTATITYTTGCGASATKPVTIIATPSAISGASNMCTGIISTLTNTQPAGVWASSNTAVATVNASTGAVMPLAAGTAMITYTTGGTCSVTSSITVNAQPSAITGVAQICMPTNLALGNTLTGGTWTSSNETIATVDATTGIVTGIATGTTNITYTRNSCFTSTSLTASQTPTAAITSAVNPCVNYSTTILFTGTTGATITYNVNGGGNLTQVLSGGAYGLMTGNIATNRTYNLVSVHDAFCSAPINTAANIVPIPVHWVGGAAGHEAEWEEANNWSCGFVPDSTSDITIPTGTNHNPVISAGRTATVKSMTIETGASVVASTGATLNVKGAFVNNNRVEGDGILKLNGNAAQVLSGTGSVENLELSNSAGASIQTASRVTIVRALTINTGTFNTNDSLVLASDSISSARINELPSGTAVAGKVKVQQYVQGGYRRYRFISHPFSSSISLSQLQRYMDITGIGGSGNGFTSTGSNAASAYRLDPYTSNSTLSYDPGWKPFTKINNAAADTNKFQRYQGVRLFMRGAKGEGLGYAFLYNPSPTVIAMSGTINQGTQMVTLSKGVDATQDYNMVGNPYPSPIDIGTVLYNAKQEGKITGAAFYVWNPSMGAGGQYMSIPIGTSAPIPYSIQALTSFQVRAADDSVQIEFNENNKTNGADNSLFKESKEVISLKIYDANYHLYDMLQVQYNNAATDEEDRNFDAVKPSGTDFAFYSLSASNRKLSIDTRPLSITKTVPLGITSAYAQEYIIVAENVIATGDTPLYLHDKLLNNYTLLQQGAEYRFAVTKDKETQGNDRFELEAKPQPVAMDNNIKVSLTPNPATEEVNVAYTVANAGEVSVTVMDISGVSIYNNRFDAANGTVRVPLKDLAAGIYLVEVASGTNKSVHRLVKE